MACTKSSMHPDGWSCPASSMRTIIRMTCCAAACSRSCRWKYGCSTRCRWEPTAARTKCAPALWWARWRASGAASPPCKTCSGFLRSPTNRPTSSSRRIAAGIRVVFSPMVWDIPPIAMVRHKDSLPPAVQEMLGNKPRSIREQLDYLEHQFKRHPASGTLHWAIAPFAPQRCTPKMLRGCAELADKFDFAVYTHVYETRGQVLIARELFADHDGSLISYMDNVGLLGPKLNIVHSVWISRQEIDRMAAVDAGIVLNQLSNFKLKSGIAPIYDMRQSGVRLGLGCDNCTVAMCRAYSRR